MKKKSVNSNISSEVLAAFLDGNATPQESNEILQAVSEDAELRELIRISQSVDADMGVHASCMEYIPMTALAATCDESNHCCLECEKYILRKRGIAYNEQEILKNSIQYGWLKEGGTALHNIGRQLENAGLVVGRKYKCCISEIVEALDRGDDVIAVIDGGELLNNRLAELKEDLFVGQIPDHTVVVLSCDVKKKTITLYDPNSSHPEDTYPLEQFIDAWKDSKNYLLTINYKEMKTYIPNPIDLSDVVLNDDLKDLREAIAENAHEIWAIDRQAQGWTYGPQRDDIKKETPCMLPYSQLSEKEKEMDRRMAMNTLKLLIKLGYDITKREETELYRVLWQRIKESKEEYHCPKCGSPVYKYQVFCDKCGEKLNIKWSRK